MLPNEVFKLISFLLFAAIVFLAGFIFGMAREENVWEQAAIKNEVAHFVFHEDKRRWLFEWIPPSRQHVDDHATSAQK